MSQARFPFLNVGTPGVYNITAAEGTLGVEIRPIPQDRVSSLREAVESYCHENSLEVRFLAMENGVACSPDNPALQMLVEAVRRTSGASPRIAKKLAGTSARFAPEGQGVVWGQSGIGPHAKDERHYIPSITALLSRAERSERAAGSRRPIRLILGKSKALRSTRDHIGLVTELSPQAPPFRAPGSRATGSPRSEADIGHRAPRASERWGATVSASTEPDGS